MEQRKIKVLHRAKIVVFQSSSKNNTAKNNDLHENMVDVLKQGFSTCGPRNKFVGPRPGIIEIECDLQDEPLDRGRW